MHINTILFIFGLLASANALAVCPICTFAVGAGIGLAQYCSIDDAVTSLWIGSLIVSLIIWTKNWLDGKNIRFYGRKIIITLVYYCSVIIPLYLKGIIGHELNKLWGIDKVLLGIIIGSVVFFIAAVSYEQLKKNNNGRAYFPFQKVVMPIAPLIILSVIFYYLTK